LPQQAQFRRLLSCPNPGKHYNQSEVPASASEKPAVETFVALSRFVIANEMSQQVKTAFLERPHMVDDATGFLRMDVISPVDNPDEIWLLTYWKDRDRTWRKHQCDERAGSRGNL
jgi:heme-degrading monooxygenase HmoA